jgi:hypothetical protein
MELGSTSEICGNAIKSVMMMTSQPRNQKQPLKIVSSGMMDHISPSPVGLIVVRVGDHRQIGICVALAGVPPAASYMARPRQGDIVCQEGRDSQRDSGWARAHPRVPRCAMGNGCDRTYPSRIGPGAPAD